MAKLEVAMERTPRTARQVLILTDTGLDYDQWWRHLRFYHVLDPCERVCRLHQVRWNKFKLNFGSFWKFLFLWAVTVSMVIPSLWRLSSISSLKFHQVVSKITFFQKPLPNIFSNKYIIDRREFVIRLSVLLKASTKAWTYLISSFKVLIRLSVVWN